MFIRKIISLILATLISMPLLILVLFDVVVTPNLVMDLAKTVVFYSLLISPIILLYGVPITIISDYVTNKYKAVKRALLALGFHLFFGLLFPFFYGLFVNLSRSEVEILFVGAITFAFLIWTFDELLRKFSLRISNNTF